MRIRPSRLVAVLFLGLVLRGGLAIGAERPEEIRERVAYVTSALANGNPADAISAVDKSFKEYTRLRDYFIGLTRAYQVTSEITIKDEDDQEKQTVLIVEWRLTLTDVSTNLSSQRTADINLTLVPKNGKWKIVDLSPIDLFSPHAAKP